ncbi:hypothetical protein ACH33_00960 [Aneurinibacillus sp. XH2]|uniref:hypothetical protein n=1 Tax=Aneurinibacillus sp. XH2 TaxID=1450761 RepID=UPI0007110C10|nr:hypothetical protein [Aneurinibacillus sp. XH2]AMA71541.1 hypothetical protein ACH33_00960 [Aneurinibacillus sp. XH2]
MFPTKENQEKLDEVFKTFYLKIRLLNFIFKTIYYIAINYNKKIRKHKQRYLLILDKSVQNTPEDDGISIIDLVPSSERTPDEWMIEKIMFWKKLLVILSSIKRSNC